ncbi:MAG: UbiA family prenyltransferase [Candidatus Thermoplasmatota archaeon]|nr:UbiA family prenyltransferase [Candidatus Thermoplasmatota archaeon]
MSRISEKSRLKAFLRVSRANLLLASIGHTALGLFIGASILSDLLIWEVPVYILLHYSIAFFGCNLNSLCDYNVDKLYKKYMSDSVDIIGKKNLKIIIFLEFLISVSIIMLFFLKGHLVVSLLGIIGLIIIFIYSAEPIRLKKQGLLSPLPILILYTIPMVGGWFIFRENITIYFLLFLVGYVLMNEGFTLVNTCEDFTEDKKEKIRTWAHVIGLKKTLKLAFIFSLCGLLCIIGLFLKLYQNNWDIVYIPAIVSIFFTAILILKSSFEVREVYLGDDLEARAKKYGTRLQKWFLMTRYPLMISLLLLIL